MTSVSDLADARLRVEMIDTGSAAWIILDGEADIANLEHLDSLLDGIELNGMKTVHLDVSGLGFFDVAALRRFTTFARRLRQSGRDLTTRGATPLFHRVAALLRVHDDLGLS